MSWVKLDDKFHSNGKTVEVGNAGAGLFTRALSYCGDHLTDGFVPAGWAREIGSPGLCRKLTDAGLWITVKPGSGPFVYVSGQESYTVEIVRPGFFIPDYLALNPNRETVVRERSELHTVRSEAGKKGAAKRWQREWQTDGKEGGNAMATVWQPDGPVPQPEPEVQELDLESVPRALPVARPDGLKPSVQEQIEQSLREAS